LTGFEILKRLRLIALLPLFILLGGCNLVVLDPAGDVAVQQRDLLIESTGLMLLIILPVMALICYFAWTYRESNTAARYEPDWDHSTALELVIWGGPLLIIIWLGAMTWMGTHLLDPYRPIGRVAEGKAVAADTEPLQVDAIALDWKWLFIYPQFGVAMVNELAAPVDRPIDFHITASSVMNSFALPALAGQIYAMPGMQTILHAVSNQPGTFQGFSGNYSGAGFSGMRFTFQSLSNDDFNAWIAKAKAGGGSLSRQDYLTLEQPSENDPARSFATVDPGLYNAIVNECVEQSKMCMSEMSAIDAKGGGGLAGVNNVLPLEYDKFARRGGAYGVAARYVASLCSPNDPRGANSNSTAAATAAAKSPADSSPLLGAGMPRPPFATFLRTPAAATPAMLPLQPHRPSNV
jgi:cytochrome o ubiquinol oxidase subunit II